MDTIQQTLSLLSLYLKHTSLCLKLPQNPRFLYEDEKICETRLKLYKLMQEANYKLDTKGVEWMEHLVKELSKKELVDCLLLLDRDKIEPLCCHVEKEKLNNMLKLDNLGRYYEDDQTGHFLLALVCSTSEQLKNLFLNLETQWFKLKFDLNISEDEITEFLQHNSITIPEASAVDILGIKNELKFYGLESEMQTSLIFKVPFLTAPNMLSNREVLVKNNFLYFPKKHKYVSLYLQHFARTKWAEKVQNLSKYWENPNRDERMEELVNSIVPNMKKLLFYSGQLETGTLTLETINEELAKFFPLCMSQIHYYLQQRSHLKHYARIQYAVFLKNAGMPYDDAIELFKSEMTKKMSEEDFKKRKYFYYFSHCYGQVGGKINYLPQSCEEIITNSPIENQEHGCPFVHYSKDNLRETLVTNDIGQQAITDILEHTRQKQYKKACCLYFSEKIGKNLEFVASPNYYYCCALEKCSVVDIEDIFKD